MDRVAGEDGGVAEEVDVGGGKSPVEKFTYAGFNLSTETESMQQHIKMVRSGENRKGSIIQFLQGLLDCIIMHKHMLY